ncbi:NACHT domain-containing protein [Acetobacterium bakii]|uniref:NACHT domain-containing protein n=1 Tax=Acetobacterium bakii TaxID=52689 RepID=A0A0L6U3U6_9FIRM|nr:NACHT domain-containing protein [Acetobacterium bakii]KNZ43002.1 hypothetical protein AKG39_04630 [Acetobacterium bakii]
MLNEVIGNIDPDSIESIKNLLPTAVKIGSQIGKNLEPNIKNIIKDKKEKDETLNSIIMYFEKSYEANSYMNTIVFKGTPKFLKELYVPLTIIKTDDHKKNFYLEEKFDLEQIFKNFPKLMIVDKAGMGKSTIVKFLMLTALEKGAPIPISIELRKLTQDIELLDLITSEINFFNGNATKEQIKKLVLDDQFLIFLDGYDEIREKGKVRITEILQKFIKQVPNTYFLLTSRDENVLDSFEGFYRFNIKPLNRIEAFSLLKRYDNSGERSERLINRISNDERFESLKEFLSNPLMVSLLYKTFEYREEIPCKKVVFYDTVFEALFNDHDLTKGGAYIHEKKSNLDICDFKKFVRALSWRTLCMGEFEFTYDELSNVIEVVIMQPLFHNLKATDLIEDLTKNVPIFHREGRIFKWVHKSFMEYFAASYICYDTDTKSKIEILKKMTFDNNAIKKYANLLDFYIDLDVETFSKHIIVPFLSKFLNIYETKYLDPRFKKLDENMLKILKSLESLVSVDFQLEYRNKTQTEFDTSEYFKEKRERKKYSDSNFSHYMRLFDRKTIDVFILETFNDGLLLKLIKDKSLDIYTTYKPKQFTFRELSDKMFFDFEKIFEVNDDITNEIYLYGEIPHVFDSIFMIITLFDNFFEKYFLDFDKCKKFIDDLEEKEESEKAGIAAFLNN